MTRDVPFVSTHWSAHDGNIQSALLLISFSTTSEPGGAERGFIIFFPKQFRFLLSRPKCHIVFVIDILCSLARFD